jgi:hypothetical protein
MVKQKHVGELGRCSIHYRPSIFRSHFAMRSLHKVNAYRWGHVSSSITSQSIRWSWAALCHIWGAHGVEYEMRRRLVCRRPPTFLRNVLVEEARSKQMSTLTAFLAHPSMLQKEGACFSKSWYISTRLHGVTSLFLLNFCTKSYGGVFNFWFASMGHNRHVIQSANRN